MTSHIDMLDNVNPQQLERMMGLFGVLRDLGMNKGVLSHQHVSAINEEQTAIVYETFADPMFSDASETRQLGLARIPQYYDRLKLIAGDPSVKASLVVPPPDRPGSSTYFSSLKAVTDTHVLECRFADPAAMEGVVPKRVRGDTSYEFTLEAEHIKKIIAGAKAYDPSVVWLHITKNGIKVEMLDINSDRLTIQLTKAEAVTETISYRYTTSVLLKLINQRIPSIACAIMSTGAMRIRYHDGDRGAYNAFLLRRDQ